MGHNHRGKGEAHPGLRLTSPAHYDRIVWLFTFGRPRAFRSRMLAPVQLRAGEKVLDVGCGTGSLARLAKAQVGESGEVHGVDASAEMIAYARQKALGANVEVAFDCAPAQQLPYPDESFDVVLNTLALHHLPKPSREQLFAEIRRVLRPHGRALIVDFYQDNHRPRGLLDHFKPRHGAVDPSDILKSMTQLNLKVTDFGPLGTSKLHYLVARPGDGEGAMPIPVKSSRLPKARGSIAPYLVGSGVGLLILAHLTAGAAVAHWVLLGQSAPILIGGVLVSAGLLAGVARAVHR